MTDEAQPKVTGPNIDELHKAREQHSAQDKAKSTHAATLADKLTQAYASRRFSVTVEGIHVPLKYPTGEERAALFDAMNLLRELAHKLTQGEPIDPADETRAQELVASTAARLCTDTTLNEAFFKQTEYGLGIAAQLLFQAERALNARASEAHAFRRVA